MSSQLIISSITKGITDRYKPFLIDNQNFVSLINVLPFRGSLLKKPAPTKLGRLVLDVPDFGGGMYFVTGVTYSGVATNVDLRALPNPLPFALTTEGTFIPGSVTIRYEGTDYTDDGNGTFPTTANLSTINYTTGVIVFDNGATPLTAIDVRFRFAPTLPVMGIEPYERDDVLNFPIQVYFDTQNAYIYNETTAQFLDVSYYKNTSSRVSWNGLDYQQFASTNYAGALWVTNGVPGFHFISVTNITQAANAVVTSTAHGLKDGDVVWFNEVVGMTQINGLTGTVTVVDPNTFSVDIDSTGFGAYISGGIAQTLTKSTATNEDGIRWYDNGSRTSVTPTEGFVNFAPPLTSEVNPPYLVGCDGIFSFKDHLIVFGTYERTSIGGVRYYPYRIRWCQLGTPFYANIIPTGSVFEGAFTLDSWYQIPGFGGFQDTNNQENIVSCTVLEDVVLVKLESSTQKFYYSGNEFDPFSFQGINFEYGSESQFATIKLDETIVSFSDYGVVSSMATGVRKIDQEIPDIVYQVDNQNNGLKRISGVRDFRNQIIYFSFPVASDTDTNFPTRMLVYNYFDNSYAIYRESATTTGIYRQDTLYTWATLPFSTWADWGGTWANLNVTGRFPFISFGNASGYVYYYNDATIPDSLYPVTQAVANVGNNTTLITSPNHVLQPGDYVFFTAMPGMTVSQNDIYRVLTINGNNFTIDRALTGVFVGGGQLARLDNFEIMTAQFNNFFGVNRGVRINGTKCLFDRTTKGEVAMDIITDFDGGPSNDPVTSPFGLGGRVLSTSSAGTTIFQQTNAAQVWQNLITSGSGATVQFRFYLTDRQMRDKEIATSWFRMYSIVSNISPGRMLT